MPVSINGTNGLVFADGSTQGTASPGRNRIINGDFKIDQRNAGASFSATNGNYCLDRWNTTSYDGSAQTGKFTVQQNAGSVTPPTCFRTYAGITSSAATSITSLGIYAFSQMIEGYNVADLSWGTAGAQTATLSFWARSSLTGTFGGAVTNEAANYNYPFTYVINAANTWEYKTVIIPGATSGTWLTTNGIGVIVRFGLGGGSNWSQTAGSWTTSLAYTATGATSLVGTNGATLYLTGVQFEKSSGASAFDFRSYGIELALCQRYFVKYVGRGSNDYEGIANGVVGNNNARVELISYAPVEMRAKPTISFGGDIRVGDGNSYPSITSVVANYGGRKNLYYEVAVSSAMTTGRGAYSYTQIASTDFFSFSAEL